MPRNTVAVQVANNVVKYARHIKYQLSDILQCPDCQLFPTLPVTGYCGHTRCTKCVEENGSCYCGCLPPPNMRVSILVQRLLEKMRPPELKQPIGLDLLTEASTSSRSFGKTRSSRHCKKISKREKWRENLVPFSSSRSNRWQCNFADPEFQYEYAKYLVDAGQYRDAAPHLAHAAASQRQIARRALNSLIKSVEQLVVSSEQRCLTRDLYRAVRATSTAAWVEPTDLECVICYNILDRPVTTPCGHTFCRKCILRTVEENNCCAICRHSLDELTIVLTAETAFVIAAMQAVTPLSPLPTESDEELIPIFKGTVAFPTVPCPILILGPFHREMIRRILDSGNRRLGMIATYGDGCLALCGTVVEVRDCLEMRDGKTLLSTVGVARFRTTERCLEQNCHTAWVIPLKDVIPTPEEMANIKLERMAEDITVKAMVWLSRLSAPLVSEIEQAFGPMPLYYFEQQWWTDPHCPKWLWWIIVILPLRPTIQILMLSTCSLHKRMMAVSRTLDIMVEMSLNYV